MKKWNMMLLALMILMLPAAGLAQDLPDFLSAVYTSVGEGLEQGAMQAMAAMDQELTLEMAPASERIEEGQTVLLTIKAGNPRPQAASVRLMLDLPERLKAAPDTAWEAVLPAAEIDSETGLLTPTETVFTREITLTPGGESEPAQITVEMSMGTRFYRAQTTVALCVPDVSAKASVTDVKDGRVQPGDAFAYQIDVVNAGTAPKDVDVKLLLPDSVTPEALPSGFAQTGNTLHGHVRAEAAGEEPGSAALTFPVRVHENALANEKDALRLLVGALHVDGERVALPRVEVCGSKISAALLCSDEDLEAGEPSVLSVVVVNSGLAAADVKVSCVLPQGLMLRDAEKEKEKSPEKTALPKETTAAQDAAIPAVIAQEVTKTLENRTLVFDVHMDAAKETDKGVISNTKVLEIPVTAQEPQKNLSEVLLGATLAWSVDDAPAQLGEAVALRVHRSEFLGISADEWNGLFWACVLMLAAIACLYAAARRSSKTEDFCCE